MSLSPLLETTDWQAQSLEEAARGFAEAKGLKLGQVAQPLRAALTGRATSPPIFAMLAVLGREESLVRIKGLRDLEPPLKSARQNAKR